MEYIHLLLISMMPIIELRGAIPIGIAQDLNPIYVYMACVLGSTLISIPLIIFFRQVMQLLKKFKVFYKLVHKIDNKINKSMKKLRSVNIVGIILFVAVPLPTTGAWTAAAIASILRMRIKDSLAGILCGNLISGTIISIISLGII